MTQRMRLLLATALTAFTLVVAGGVAGAVAAHRAGPAAPAAQVSATAVPSAAGQPEPVQGQVRQGPAGPAPASREDGPLPAERDRHGEHDD